jgi:hypothetical protein
MPSASKSWSAKKEAASKPSVWCSSEESQSARTDKKKGGAELSHTGHVLHHPTRILVDHRLLRPAAMVSVGKGVPCDPGKDNDITGKTHFLLL